MKRIVPALALLGAALLAGPASAQSAVPLLRVYIDHPYFYEFQADIAPRGDEGRYRLHVFLEGKEVGKSEIVYDCASGAYEETEIDAWTGGAEAFLPAALMSFARLYC
ncbi:hypothetical protein VE25_15805 [Devosia geojensis]|uniref:Uncharacterized protein n=1 Tax=Devosia geojensis TaxID=443610 RepID=A0A0F5FPM3_9HYPH|nr:hypothetical protein [Devosia geojensis]KKB10849.1 hypothetical protein VE25_15805 [Devosia geojensis]